MLSQRSIAAVALAAGFLAAAPAWTQEEIARPPASDSVAGQLDRLNRTLARIAELLERQVQGQRLELSLQSVELAGRRVETIESDLARARSERTGLEDNRHQVRSVLETLASQVERSDPESLATLEERSREMERTLELLEVRIKERNLRSLELENELERRRRDLEVLQDWLAREVEAL